ncbi:MAG: hypothetical protein K8S56_04335, partial [Candidatus Cloacimonetes bacterium]|nr:hypothetical protein [Candidatus Cloacimonadota bacterium]
MFKNSGKPMCLKELKNLLLNIFKYGKKSRAVTFGSRTLRSKSFRLHIFTTPFKLLARLGGWFTINLDSTKWIKLIFYAVAIDLLISLYLTGAILFLCYHFGGLAPFASVFYWLPGSLPLLAGIFLHDSIGYRYILKTTLKRKPYATIVVLWLLPIVTMVTGWVVVEIHPYKFFTKFHKASHIASGLLHPDTRMLGIYLGALAETIFLALLATLFAVPFAFILSFVAARNLMPRTFLGNTIYVITRTIATVGRSIEAIVWAIIFSVWVGIGPFAGMLALMIHSVAALTKLYSEQIENINEGPIEAIRATGASTLQVWLYGVIPQVLSPYLAF